MVNSILLKVLNCSVIPFCEVCQCLKQTHKQEGKCTIFSGDLLSVHVYLYLSIAHSCPMFIVLLSC